MKIVYTINFVLVTLLSIAAGAPKILQVPDELAFFAQLGLGPALLIGFGIVQVIGGVLLVPRVTRRWAAGLVATMFLASAVMMLVAGKVVFGVVSLVPVLMVAVVVKQSLGAPER